MKTLTPGIDHSDESSPAQTPATAGTGSVDALDTHGAALEVLLILRRRLIDRLASTVVDQRASLLNGNSHTNDPLLYAPDVAQMLRRLSELDSAISGLNQRSSMSRRAGGNGAKTGHAAAPAALGPFSRFVELVGLQRLEEASRELARVFQLPLDRVITATRFFARCFKADPKAAEALQPLVRHAADWPEPESIKLLIKTFGFQAIESRQALQALQNRGEEPETKAVRR